MIRTDCNNNLSFPYKRTARTTDFDLCKSLYNRVWNTHTNHSAGQILSARAWIH